MASNFQLIPTHNPVEWMVALTIPDRIINKNRALLPSGNLLEIYTPYNEFSWGGTLERVQEFGEYRYTGSSKNAADNVTFYFAKPRTQEEKNTPFRVRADTHQYVWPAVLLDQYIIKSSFNITDGSQTTTRYFQRYKLVPSTPANSVVKIEQFLSDTPWTRNELNHQQPVTAEISGSYLGLPINFQRCLHRRLVLPELVPDAQIVLGAGMEGSGLSGTPREQVFPATNFTDWRPFVFSDDVRQDEHGMYFREKVTIYPPSRVEPIQSN